MYKVEMPVCGHHVPVSLKCVRCISMDQNTKDGKEVGDLERLVVNLAVENSTLRDRIEQLEEEFDVHEESICEELGCLESKIDAMDYFINSLGSIRDLILNAQTAESLFASKVHDLKYIDKKRDDVINALCQKIEAIGKRLINLETNDANSRR